MEEKPLKGRSFADLINSPVNPVRSWVEPGVIPRRGKVLNGGEGKIGKSWINLQACKDLATGANLFGHPEMKVVGCPRILYVEREIAEAEMQVRVQKMFRGLSADTLEKISDLLWCASWDTAIKIDERSGLDRLERYVETYQPNIIILDPAAKLMIGDENVNREVNRVFENFDRLMEKYRELDLTLILTHHASKSNSTAFNQKDSTADRLDPYTFRGASAWKDAPDAILTFCTDGPKNRDRSWSLQSRLTSRHSAGLNDFRLGVHTGGGIGVTYLGDITPEPAKAITLADLPKKATQGRMLV